MRRSPGRAAPGARLGIGGLVKEGSGGRTGGDGAFTVTDKTKSYLLDVVSGRVTATEVAPDVPADFKFDGPYASWVILGKGEKDFQSLVMGGKIKFRGSMPTVMGMMGQWNRLIKLAQELPKEF